MAELGQFYIGQTPAWPLQLTVLDPDGAPRDLTDLTVEVALLDPLGEDVPGGTTTVIDAEAGSVQFNWPADPFATAGEYLARTSVAGTSTLDYASDVPLNVHPRELLYTDLRVTPTEVERYTRTAVGNPEIDTAQFDISLAVARNLHDDITWDYISSADQQWLKIAIAHQAAAKDTGPIDAYSVPGVKSVKTGDLAITYSDSANSGAEALLSPMAALAVRRLSWVGTGTMHATPFLGTTVLPPDTWHIVGSGADWLRGPR